MTDYNSLTVKDLRALITDKDDFTKKMFVGAGVARKGVMVDYLNGRFKVDEVKNGAPTMPDQPIKRSNSLSDMQSYVQNKPMNPSPPKVDKNFMPDPSKLEKIRESLPQPEEKQVNIDIPEELKDGLDDSEVHELGNLLSGEASGEAPGYEYDEISEAKCKRYVALHKQLKPLVESTAFKSSKEKLLYVQQYIDSTRMSANLTNWFFRFTEIAEKNKTVNGYVKLRGYTRRLAQRRVEIDTYVEEIKIKYMDELGGYMQMPVEAQLGLLLLETVYDTHRENSADELREQIQKSKSQPAPQKK